jgi:transcriptional regulator with XRE-family HTH domain
MELGQLIRQRRKALKLTQEQVARRADLSLTVVHKIEAGSIRDPHYSTLAAIAGALGVDIGELVRDPVPLGETGRKLFRRALRAARNDQAKDVQAINRQVASEGMAETISSYEEEQFRVTLRERGYPDEDFEEFIWPLIQRALRTEMLEHELARLKEERKEFVRD